MRKMVEWMKGLRFGFSEVDVDLNGLEFLGVMLMGIGMCVAPFLIKWILLAVHFGGV